MQNKIPKLSFSFLKIFILSTFIPMALITFIIANLFHKNYTKDISSLVETSLHSICANLNTYLRELEQASLMPYYNESFFLILAQIQAQEGPITQLQQTEINQQIGNILSFSQYTRNDIVGTLIVANNQKIYSSTNMMDCTFDTSYQFNTEPWYEQAITGTGEAVFIPPHTINYYNSTGPHYSNPTVISVSRAIVNLRTREPICVIKIDTNMKSFSEMFQNLNWYVPSQIVVTDSEHNLIYCNNEADSNAIYDLASHPNEIQYNNQTYLVYCQQESNYGWNIFVLLDKNSIVNKNIYIYLMAIFLYGLGLLIATLIYFLYSRKMIQTINTINFIIEDIKKGNLHGVYKFPDNNELQLLINSITYITSLLEDKIEQGYKLELQQRDFQLKALQQQINPHFLFNTLNGFIALNQLGKQNDLEHSIYALTNMLRYTLSKSSEDTIEHEMLFLTNYCLLQKLRFRERLEYQLNYDQDLAHVLIPTLLFQPLVENAIIHGIEPLNQPCHLTVDIMRYKENSILITIEDDGIGFDLQTCTKNIGLLNVQTRLQLINSSNEFHIESTPSVGTIITILIEGVVE